MNNLVPSDWHWGKNLFTSTKDYNIMRRTIKNKSEQYQYFKGIAFPKQSKTKVENYIQEEIDLANFQITSYVKSLSKDGRSPNRGKIIKSGLERFLKDKIDEYEKHELKIFKEIQNAAKKNKINVPFINKYHGLPPREKVAIWDQLLLNTILSQINSEQGNIVLDQVDALYCFLMSDELYQAIKNIQAVKTVFSRKNWERSYYKKRDNYTRNTRKLEDEMWQMFKSESSKGATRAFLPAIMRGFSEALDNVNNITEKDKMIIIEDIIKTSFKKLRKDTNTAEYKVLHDKLKDWGKTTYIFLKDYLERMGYNSDDLKEVKIGNDKATFFIITGDADVETLAEDFIDRIKKYIETCINMSGSNGGFPLTVLPFKKKYFAKETAENALIAANKILTKTKVDTSITRFVEANKGTNAIKKSNSVLSGVLGEIANSLIFSKMNLQTVLTGNQQQYYKFNQKGQYTGVSKVGLMSEQERKANGWKSSGQFFSDISISNLQENLGINVKRYITDKNTFTLTTIQSEGLKLNSVNLRRYLNDTEITLLRFVQANQKLINSDQTYTNFKYNLREVAEYIMMSNLTSVLRITGAGAFDTINYLIAANGHFIPASAVLQYFMNMVLKNKYKLFEIKNTNPFNYLTVKKAVYENEYSGIQNNEADKIDVGNLLTSIVYKENEDKGIMYRFHEFKVSIRDLMNL